LSNLSVSVLMSVYNGEKYLREAIESILNQTFKDFEFIIINDGSTDSSKEIILFFKDPRIIYLENIKNIGLTKSLNKGMKIAKGELIARMDADDLSSSIRFSRQVSYLKHQPQVGVLGTQMEVINEAGKTINRYDVPCHHSMIVWTLLFGRSFAHPSIMIRRSVIEEVRGYDSAILYSGDFELWTRLVDRTQFANLPEALVRYRTHTESISRTQADAQRASVLLARWKMVSRILGREVPMEIVQWLHQSQSPEGSLTEAQAKQAIALIFDLYNTLCEKKLVKSHELSKVREDMLRRVITAAGCIPQRDEESAKTSAAFPRWRSILPNPLLRVGRALVRPRRVISALLLRIELILEKLKNRSVDERRNPVAANMSLKTTHSVGAGITVIVLTYNRMKALAALLKSLLRQEMGDSELELIICNNSPCVRLKRSRFTKLGRLLRGFKDVKIFNSNHNWRTAFRYATAVLAKNDTILFIDDDITIMEPGFIRYMFDTFQTLQPIDLLSCWNTLWVEWKTDYFSCVSMSFKRPEIKELTETDTCGPGICMFNKRILSSPKILNMPPSNFPKADDMAFSLIAALEFGSRSYYLPSYGMLKFHEQRDEAALYDRSGHYEDLYAFYKFLLNSGYRPVLSKLSRQSVSEHYEDSPEFRAVQILPVVKHSW